MIWYMLRGHVHSVKSYQSYHLFVNLQSTMSLGIYSSIFQQVVYSLFIGKLGGGGGGHRSIDPMFVILEDKCMVVS